MLPIGFGISISGCSSIIKKKLELYRDKHPGVQLFFVPVPELSCDVCIMPASSVPSVLESSVLPKLVLPPLIAFGEPSAMPAATAAGCADYLCVPWEPVELFERAARCFRRTIVEAGSAVLVCGSDRRLRCIADGGEAGSRELSQTEYKIYCLFSRNRGQFFDRETLSSLFRDSVNPQSRAADMQIFRLRQKIDELLRRSGCPLSQNPIRTAAGRGWGFNRS